LIVHIKRFTQLGTKLKTPLNFPFVFSFDSDYMQDDLALNENSHSYELYAIIVHQGYSAHKGHYYCFIKSQQNNTWYKYDDNTVKVIDDMRSVALQTQKAYILFYKKVNIYKSNRISNLNSPNSPQKMNPKNLITPMKHT
jgi:ubiquitin carboxyl-terminal hydrolase 36/42